MKKRIFPFIMSFILLSGLFTPEISVAAELSDAVSPWALAGVTEAIEKGFVPTEQQGGYTGVITRSRFCRLAVKWVEYVSGKSIDAVLKEKGVKLDFDAFTDTNDPDIFAAFALGITAGTGDGKFEPFGKFTRQQAATMIMNTCRVIGADVDNSPASDFADMNTVASWAVDGVNYVRANGIMQGTGNNNFTPNTFYTVQESIVTLNNIKHDTLPETDIKNDALPPTDIKSGYVDSEISYSDLNVVENGYYITSTGWRIEESDYNDMIAKRKKIYAECIKSGMNDYEKVYVLLKWIDDNVEYRSTFKDKEDMESSPNSTNSNSTSFPKKYYFEDQTAWSALILGYAVCAGKTEAYQFLLNGLGIDALFVIGAVGNGGHSWNLVKLGGAYYHVDATNSFWGDYKKGSGGIRSFLFSDDTMKAQRYSWAESYYPAASKDYKFPVLTVIGDDRVPYIKTVKFPIAYFPVQNATLPGEEVTVTANLNSGHASEFDYWEVVGNVNLSNKHSKTITFKMPFNDVTLKAHAKPINPDSLHSISVSSNNPSYGMARSTGYTEAIKGDTILIEAEAYEGYVFDRWETSPSVTLTKVAGSPKEMVSFIMPDSSVTIKAHFKPADGSPVEDPPGLIKKNIIQPEYGDVGIDKTKAVPGEIVTMTAYPYGDNVFDSWEVISNNEVIYTATTKTAKFTMPKGDVTVNAYFSQSDVVKATKYYISASANDRAYGYVHADKTGGVEGESVVLRALANKGYVFECWEINGEMFPNLTKPTITITIETFNISARGIFRPE